MEIFYDGGDNIDAEGLTPSEEAWGIKNFNVTGNNTTSSEMAYNIKLIVTLNTFTNGALKYKLISINPGDNGDAAPSIDLTDIEAGENEIHLGNAYFDGPTEGSKVHSYDYYLGEGYGKSNTIYNSSLIGLMMSLPSLKCQLQNDRFTVLDINKGNGKLTYPIGLISFDELFSSYMLSDVTYLHNDIRYWSMSPTAYIYIYMIMKKTFYL